MSRNKTESDTARLIHIPPECSMGTEGKKSQNENMGAKSEPGTARWEINGQTFEFDLEDADIMERYENAFEAMAAEEAQIAAETKKSAQIRAYCMLYRHLFDNLFGDGAADKIFAEKPMNAAEHEAVYDSFLDFVRKQTAAAAERRAARLGKYLPKKK